MKLSDLLLDNLRTAEAATYNNGGDFGFSSEMYDCPIKGQQVLKELEELGLVSVDWNTEVNGRRIHDDQFELTEEGFAAMEEAVRPTRHEVALAAKVDAVRREVFEVREHGDERMRQVQDLLAQAQALLEQAAMGK